MTDHKEKAISHAYVIPAYGESPYLEACLRSLVNQSCRSPILVAASRPGPSVSALASQYGARFVKHDAELGIGNDWNAALEASDADWITLAHQDDVYSERYGARVTAAIRATPDVIMLSTDYAELRNEAEITSWSTLLFVKRALIELSYLGRRSIRSNASKRRLLRFGCPIACPSVTFSRLNGLRFDQSMKTNLDWDAWLRLAAQEGRFAHLREILMHHRIHPQSETSDGIRSGARADEDLRMFLKLWPRPIAAGLSRIYARAYEG